MERGAIDITVVRVAQVADILKTNWLILLGVQQLNNGNESSRLEINEKEFFITQNQSINYQNILKEIDVLKQDIKKLKK
jgi:hypothetical protein